MSESKKFDINDYTVMCVMMKSGSTLLVVYDTYEVDNNPMMKASKTYYRNNNDIAHIYIQEIEGYYCPDVFSFAGNYYRLNPSTSKYEVNREDK
jgi:hypothetical protein